MEKLCFNWSVGRDLVIRKAEERWGSGVVEQLSFDLKEAFPQEKGFSSRNMWRMKQWYLFFSTTEANEKLTQLVAELQKVESPYLINMPQTVAVLNVESSFPIVLGMIPWGHQTDIVSKCKSVDEAMFYLRECILSGWSRQTLNNSLKANLYKSHGKAISNFREYLPEAQSRMAQEITKDNYDFGFITVPVNYREEQLEVADPEYAGKLNYYVNAVDELLKGPDDNPTIGLLICSDKDETEVRWAFKGIQTPMGVASYDNVQIASSNLLPSAEELQARVRLVEEELNNNPAMV